MKKLNVPTKRGVLLDGVLFDGGSDTVMIAITGIHGNFYSNPFYYNIGNDRFFSKVTRLYGEILGIPADRVYIKYDDISVWGVNGMAIDRRAWR